MLRREPSASFNEYVPFGDSAFFLGSAMEVLVLWGDFAAAVPRFGEVPRLGDLPRLGEISPNGERTGDRTGDLDLVGLLFGDNERLVEDLDVAFLGEISPNGERTGDRTGDFDMVGLLLGDDRLVGDLGMAFFGERLFDVLPGTGDKLPLPFRPMMDVPVLPSSGDASVLLANEVSNEARMGLQLSPNTSSPVASDFDDDEMCDALREFERRPPPPPRAILCEGRESLALLLLPLAVDLTVPRRCETLT